MIDKEYDIRIDFLKVFGLLGVILCHVAPSPIIFNIRNFDVSMLIFASGMGFCISGKNYLISSEKYFEYIGKRVRRLIIPTWKFLFFYFVLFNVLSLLPNGGGISFDLKDYVLSFSLISGIGYVWIFRIYFVMALIAPFLFVFLRWSKKNKLFSLLIIISIVGINEILTILISGSSSNIFCFAVKYLLLYTIGYGVIYFIGMVVSKLENKTILLAVVLNFCLFIVSVCMYKSIDLASMKYPPRIMYISYGVGVSGIMLVLIDYLKLNKLSKRFLCGIRFVSRESLLVYYFHIIWVQLFNYKVVSLDFCENYWSRYIVVVLLSVFCTFIYISIRERLKNGGK